MKITKKQLHEMVKKAISKKLQESVNFSSKRQIIRLAEEAAMDFEKNIVSIFGLENPDNLTPELQRKYLEVVRPMQQSVVRAVMEAVQELIKFPKKQEEK